MLVAAGIVIAAFIAAVAMWPAPVSAAKPAAGPVPVPAARAAAPRGFPSLDGETDRAHAILERLASRYRLLDGVSVVVGRTPAGEQAVAFYTRSEIVVSPTHTAPLARILGHEIWHIIDWRDNGRIDWGEALPPADAAAYVR